MKFALVLLCVVAAAQARSTAVQSSERSLAALGENPWIVHLRLAVATSGYLNTCAGSLINEGWVLTFSGCLNNVRFAWIRYGVVTVVNPELVTEGSQTRLHPELPLGLLNINRVVHTTANIAPASLSTEVAVPEDAKLCVFGKLDDGPGEQLSCFQVGLESEVDANVLVAHSDDNKATEFDLGAPLVVDGVQIGVLTAAGDDQSAARFVNPGNAIPWIEQETGVSFSS